MGTSPTHLDRLLESIDFERSLRIVKQIKTRVHASLACRVLTRHVQMASTEVEAFLALEVIAYACTQRLHWHLIECGALSAVCGVGVLFKHSKDIVCACARVIVTLLPYNFNYCAAAAEFVESQPDEPVLVGMINQLDIPVFPGDLL